MLNKRVLRLDKSSPYEELCKRIGLSSFREQRLAKVLCTVFKILASDLGPAPLITTILDLPKVNQLLSAYDHGDTLHRNRGMLFQTSLGGLKHTLLLKTT